MLNVFVENINGAVREQLRIARQHRLKDIKLFFDENVRKSSEIKIVTEIQRGYVKLKAVNQISYSFVETLSSKLMVLKLCTRECYSYL